MSFNTEHSLIDPTSYQLYGRTVSAIILLSLSASIRQSLTRRVLCSTDFMSRIAILNVPRVQEAVIVVRQDNRLFTPESGAAAYPLITIPGKPTN